MPICLTLFSCSSCHAVCMSLRWLIDRSAQPSAPPPCTHHRFRSLRNSLAMWGYSGTNKAATPWPLLCPSWPECHTFSLHYTKQKQILSRACAAERENSLALYQCAALTIFCPHNLCFLRQVLPDTTTQRWRVSFAWPYLPCSPSQSSLFLCAQLNKQARGRFPLWKAWKMARTFPPVSGISIWRRHSHSHCPPCPISVCVLSLCCCNGFHSSLATIRLAHQVDSIRIDNLFQ